MIWLIIPATTAFWMVGGQVNKAVRRFCIPSLAVAATLLRASFPKKDDDGVTRVRWAALGWALLIPVLSMGYGVDSGLMKIFKKELTVRIVYAIILSLPFLVFELVAGKPLWMIGVTVAALIGAFQVRAGKLGTIRKFDFLIEDIVRGSVVGGLIVWHVV